MESPDWHIAATLDLQRKQLEDREREQYFIDNPDKKKELEEELIKEKWEFINQFANQSDKALLEKGIEIIVLINGKRTY